MNNDQEHSNSGAPQYGYPVGQIPVPAPRRGLPGWAIALIVVGGFILLGIIMSAAMTSSISDLAAQADMGGKLQEKVVEKGDSPDAGKIAIIPLFGAISGQGTYISGEGMLYKTIRQIRRAAEDDKVKAVVINLDSPGGGLTASDLIYHEITRLKESGKKVVISVGTLAASGGLYISSSADYIVASRTSMVGSIGVIMTRFQVDELMKKMGIKWDPIKSGGMKDLGSPFRDLTVEERQYFEELIETFHDHFIQLVADGRHMQFADVKKLANGKIYTAQQALDYGLIDEIGYIEDAIQKAKELTNLESPTIVRYKKGMDFGPFSQFFDEESSLDLGDIKSLLMGFLDMEGTPQIEAKWNGRIVEE